MSLNITKRNTEINKLSQRERERERERQTDRQTESINVTFNKNDTTVFND